MMGAVLDYPATFEFSAPAGVDRWRVVGNPILAIPHMVVLPVLVSVEMIVWVLSWFAVVFTGRLPEGLAGFQCMVIRYKIRVGVYAGFLRNSYPPFDFDAAAADNGEDPEVSVGFRPELENRSRVSVVFRFVLVVPVAVMLVVWTALAAVVTVVGFFAVLFMGRWPVGMRSFVVGVNGFYVRAWAYTGLLTDRFPPLGLR